MNIALLATGGGIDFGSIFTDLAIILIVAKIAAELFERIRVPAVLGEIFAGIVAQCLGTKKVYVGLFFDGV